MLRSTAIWNRDSILELLSRELARSIKENSHVCVMLAGIDQFQDINRDHGQAQGEMVVGEVARRLTAGMRAFDHVGRYSTEQLLIVTPGHTLAEGMALGEKLRGAIAETDIVAANDKFRVTLTISVAGLDESRFQDDQDLLRTLERAAYRSSINGGNKVVPAGEVPLPNARIRSARRRLPLSIIIPGVLVAIFILLYFVAPAWTCAPLRLGELLDASELPPPLPVDCFPSADQPSEAVLQSLDSQREAEGLTLQRTLTCKVRLLSGAAGRATRARQQQWMEEVYSGGTLQVRRHVLLATTEDVPGGIVFTVELCVMPWWRYVNEAGDSCWSQLGFWR